MKTTGNRELDHVLARHEARLRREGEQETAGRFAVLRWVTEVDYYATEAAACEALDQLPGISRVGLVDRTTGETWATTVKFRFVKEALEGAREAPENLERVDLLLAKQIG